MKTRRITITLGVTAGGALAAAFIGAGICNAATYEWLFDPTNKAVAFNFDPIIHATHMQLPWDNVGASNFSSQVDLYQTDAAGFKLDDPATWSLGGTGVSQYFDSSYWSSGDFSSTWVHFNTVAGTLPAGAPAAEAPGTVVNVLDWGGWMQNTYEWVPGTGSLPGHMTDTLTLFGFDMDISWLVSLFGFGGDPTDFTSYGESLVDIVG